MIKTGRNFDKEKEFPNYFKAIVKALQKAGSTEDESYDKVIHLLEENIAKILGRLQVPHVPDPASGKIETKDFFKSLELHLQNVVKEWNEAHKGETPVNLKVYLGGGVVRSLLAYVYKQLHTILEARKSTNANSNKRAMKMAGVKDGRGSLAEFMQREISSPEFEMLRTSKISDDAQLYNLFVLGVGSDLDVYYEIDNPSEELKQALEKAAADFIDSAQNQHATSDYTNPIKRSLLPESDVNERHAQLSKSIAQGGSSMDWLSFGLYSKKNGPRLIQPNSFPSHFPERLDLLRDFVDGLYHYLAGSSESLQELTIRGLRALLEVPFLSIKDVALMEAHLKKLNLQNLDEATRTQLDKLVRNAYTSAANNRAFREVHGILKILAENRLIPYFVDKTPITADREIVGENLGIVKKYMVPVSKFLETSCVKVGSDYEIYHGTDNPQAILNIIRGGFITSNDILGQGTSVFGSGLYTTKDKNLAKGHGALFFALKIVNDPNIRIVNLDTLSKTEIKALEAEAFKKGFLDVNELLRNDYKIDIIIREHIIIQNISVLQTPQLSDILKVMMDEALAYLRSDEIHKDLERWREKGISETVFEACKPIGDVQNIYTMITGEDSEITKQIEAQISSAVSELIKYLITASRDPADFHKMLTAYAVLAKFQTVKFISQNDANTLKNLIVSAIKHDFGKTIIANDVLSRLVRLCVETGLKNDNDIEILKFMMAHLPKQLDINTCSSLRSSMQTALKNKVVFDFSPLSRLIEISEEADNLASTKSAVQFSVKPKGDRKPPPIPVRQKKADTAIAPPQEPKTRGETLRPGGKTHDPDSLV